MAGVVLVLMTIALVGARAAGLLPPDNPSQSIPPSSALRSSCSTVPVTPACMTAATAAIDNDRASEGVGPISLPSNFASLTIQEETFVVADLERIDRGLTPVVGLTSALDSLAQQGADSDSDPPLTAPGNPEVGNWASTANPLYADAVFMYDDGPGGVNADCTGTGQAGCWEHRDNLLLSNPQPLLMGVGDTTSDPDHGSIAELIVANDTSDSPYFAWASEVAGMSLNLSATQLSIPAAVGVTNAATVIATASGSGMNLSTSLTGSGELAVTSPPCSSLADGASCPIAITFTPTIVGEADATLTVTAIDGPHLVTVLGVTNPDPPAGLTATPSPAGIVLTWGAADDGGSALAAYRILRATASGQPGALVATVPGSATSWTDTSPTPGATDYYSVEAVNAAGASGPTAEAQIGPDFPVSATTAPGYWMVDASGSVYGFGSAPGLGGPRVPATASAVDIVSTPSGNGYWVVDNRGEVSAFGDAPDLGGAPKLNASEVVTSLSSTPDGQGYWLFTNKGRVLTYGDAPFLGDMSGRTLNGPVIGSVATPTGNGYYMVASDGGIFTFGDATFDGSMGGQQLNQPVVGLAPSPRGPGYWLVAKDGGIFAFAAPFLGSMGSTHLNRPVIGMVAYGDGYLMVASDGGIFDFSHLAFVGSLGAQPPVHPVTAVSPVG